MELFTIWVSWPIARRRREPGGDEAATCSRKENAIRRAVREGDFGASVGVDDRMSGGSRADNLGTEVKIGLPEREHLQK